jgi:hemerythrin-like domain-containing protein
MEPVDHLSGHCPAGLMPVSPRLQKRRFTMNPIEMLKNEHDAVRLTLRILDIIVTTAEKSGAVPQPEHLEQLLEFFRVFVDTCHHGKEEAQLFPAMEAVGISREGGPIGVMLSEHERGRGHVQGMNTALKRIKENDPAAIADLSQHARAYIQLLDQHIEKENTILFVMASQHLPATTLNELYEAFEKFETEIIGEGRHEAFHRMLDELKSVYLD